MGMTRGSKTSKPVFTRENIILRYPKYHRKVLLRYPTHGGLYAYSYPKNYRFDFNENKYYYQMSVDDLRWVPEEFLSPCIEPALYEGDIDVSEINMRES